MHCTFTRYVSRLILSGVFALLMFSAAAQHYDFASSTSTFTPVSGTAVDAIETDDAISATIPIGFSFTYFGTAYTDLKASSNGFLTFNLAASSDGGNQFNGSQTRLIAPLWDDLHGSGGTATYSTTGSVGSRVFTFEWINWRWNYNATAAGISFQVKLYETSNIVQFIYRQEAGALTSPSASIGIVSVAASNRFYSLDNTSASPVYSPTGNNSLNTKPATNQVYSFTPGTGPVAPTTAASQVVVANNTGRSMNLSWTNGNGTYRAVLMKQTSTAEDITVTDGAFVSASSSFGDAYFTSDWYCVYNGSGNSVLVDDLDPGLPYRIKVVEYNGLANAQKYFNTAGTNNPASITTTLVKPITPISTLKIHRVSGSEASVDVAEGDGFKRAVFLKKTNTLATAPVVDNTTYTANTVFGSGSQIGSSGWYCVFNGSSTSPFTVTNLSANSDYVAYVVDYNGNAGQEMYNIGSSATNPITFKTFIQVAVPTYTFAASSGTFTPLTGATAVASINQGGDFTDDDQISAAIPVGFTFKFAGVPFTQLYATSNGFISFNPHLPTTSNTTSNDLTNSLNRPLIAPFWDDNTGTFGEAKYATTGVAPNRVFTIEFLNWAANWQASSAGFSFQIKLYETSNKVEMVYRKEAGALVSVSASLGLAFANLGSGNFISLNNVTTAPTASTTAETSTINAAPATGQVYSFTPVKMNQTITFPAISDRFFGPNTFALSATSNSGLPISFSSSNPNVVTIADNVVTMTGVGSVTITASQAGDDVFNAATDVQRSFIVNKGNQTISSFFTTSSRAFTTTPYQLNAVATSGLAVEYSSNNPAVATVSGSTVTLVGVGTAEITASQPGNANYNAAPSLVQTLTVNKGSQSVTFTSIPQKTYGDAPFTVSASASSGLPLTFTTSNPLVATVSGSTVTIVGAGSAWITASQPGNANYNETTGSSLLSVSKANQTINFPPIADKTLGDPSFTITVTTSSGLPLVYNGGGDSFPVPVSLNGPSVTLATAGRARITVVQGGNENYNAAQVSQSFCVNPPKPVVRFSNLDTNAPVLLGEPVFSNQWFLEGVEYSTSTDIQVTEPGVFTLVTSKDGCASVPSDAVSIVITGTEETSDAGVKIFPNPVVNELVVDVTALHEKTPVRIELHDAAGRTIYSELATKKAIVKMEKQKPGLYLLKIQGSKKVITKQIIKK